MDDKTLEALKASIQHWRENETGPLDDASASGSHCALCHHVKSIGCTGCPVFQKTGNEGCEGTPWENAVEAWVERFHDENAWRNAAKAEREFLESLLPKRW